MVAAPARPARVVAVNGRRWWRCGDCGRTLGELVGAMLVVKAGSAVIRLPIVPGTEQVCPRCGATSALEAA